MEIQRLARLRGIVSASLGDLTFRNPSVYSSYQEIVACVEASGFLRQNGTNPDSKWFA